MEPYTDRTVRASLLPFDGIQIQRQRGKVDKFERQQLLGAIQRHKQKKQQQKSIIYKTCKNFNDPSFIFKQQEQKRNNNFVLQKIRELDKKYHEKYPIISPQQTGLLIWNLIMILLLYYLLIQTPVTIFIVPGTYFNLALVILSLLFLLVDFLVRANIGLYIDGQFITQRQFIFKEYIRFQFWIDLISWIILLIFLIPQLQTVIYIKIIFYLKIYTLLQIDNQIKNKLQLMKIRYAIYLILRVVGIIFFIVNWISCIYFAIDHHFYKEKGYYYSTGQLWITDSIAGDVNGNYQQIDILTQFPWYVWWNYALYWAVQTSSGIGYGDITPKNPASVAFVTVCILLTPVFFSFYINSIWQIVGQIQKPSIKYADNMKNLKIFLKDMDLPQEMDKKIRDYYHQIWKSGDQNQQQDSSKEGIAEMLSKELHNEIFNIQMFQEINQSKNLSQSWEEIVKKIANNVQQQKLVEGQIIYDIGQRNQYLYFLFKGSVNLTLKNNWLSTQIIEGNNFGQQQFVTLIPRYHRAQANLYSKVAKLSAYVFKQILKIENQLLHQKYCQYKDQIIFSRKNYLLSVKCWKCQSEQHFTVDCPNLNIWKFQMIRHYKKLDNFAIISNVRQRYKRTNLNQKKIIGNTFNQYTRIDQPKIMLNYYKQYNVQM